MGALLSQLLNRRLGRMERALLVVVAIAIPIAVWQDAGPLFGVVAALSFTPMMVLGALAHDWLLRPPAPGPRWLAPLGPAPMLPMVFVCAGWLLHWSAAAALAAAVAVYLPMGLHAYLRHPGASSRGAR